jgi:hypothetical protein
MAVVVPVGVLPQHKIKVSLVIKEQNNTECVTEYDDSVLFVSLR